MGENPQGLGPHCGASENSLPPGTAVAAYTIRQLLSQNGEGFVYLGSSSQEEAVWIKEFFPNGLCRRDPASQSLSICPGCEAKVKYFRAAFADTNQTLGKLTGVDSLPTLLELIEEHNTVYAVFRYIPGQTLAQWLEDHPGGMPWLRAKPFLMSLYNAVSNLHKKGIFHQGISPSTILLDRQGKLYLLGFSISEVRCAGGELATELYSGYAAPEQYDLQSWQGTWTDVYALGAVTYRVLTGQELPPAFERIGEEDPILPPSNGVPENISQAVCQALEPQVRQRLQNVDDFMGKILETVSSNTAVFQVEPPTASAITVHLGERQNNNKMYTIITMLVTLVMLLIFGSLLYQSLPRAGSKQEPLPGQSEETPPTPGGELLPSFVGRSPETVMRDANYYDRYFFTVEEQYHEEIGKGYVCGQKPEAGTAVPRGSTITLYVSLGSEKLTMPDLYGAQQADAIARMNSLGMDYRIYQLENSEVEPGQVFRTDPPAGTVLKKTALPRVVLYVAKESTQQKQETTKPQVIRPRTQSQTAEEGDDESAAEQ